MVRLTPRRHCTILMKVCSCCLLWSFVWHNIKSGGAFHFQYWCIYLVLNISDELAGFEEAWKGNNIGQVPGWNAGYDVHRNQGKLRLLHFSQYYSLYAQSSFFELKLLFLKVLVQVWKFSELDEIIMLLYCCLLYMWLLLIWIHLWLESWCYIIWTYFGLQIVILFKEDIGLMSLCNYMHAMVCISVEGKLFTWHIRKIPGWNFYWHIFIHWWCLISIFKME